MSESWRDRANCRDRETSFFFPELSARGAAKQIAQVKAVCSLCPVSAECLAYAINNDEQHGIWGGLLPKERKKVSIQEHHAVISKEIAGVYVRKYVRKV